MRDEGLTAAAPPAEGVRVGSGVVVNAASPTEREREFQRILGELLVQPTGRGAFYTLDVIDAKTQALLAHVSIMIAISALVYADGSQAPFTRYAVLAEMVAYLLIALGCLRSITILSPTQVKHSDDLLELRLRLVLKRRTAYRTSLLATVTVTIAFLLTLVAVPIMGFF